MHNVLKIERGKGAEFFQLWFPVWNFGTHCLQLLICPKWSSLECPRTSWIALLFKMEQFFQVPLHRCCWLLILALFVCFAQTAFQASFFFPVRVRIALGGVWTWLCLHIKRTAAEPHSSRCRQEHVTVPNPLWWVWFHFCQRNPCRYKVLQQGDELRWRYGF